ncbi:hypothetical protein MYA_5977 [Burkholderia sp. KJ006]|nr:hypothetical protein MYA_5977 [Burkholderia sp. KJ006]
MLPLAWRDAADARDTAGFDTRLRAGRGETQSSGGPAEGRTRILPAYPARLSGPFASRG